MFIRLFLSHIVLSVVTLFLLSIAFVVSNDIIYGLLFFIMLVLYFYSGYLFTHHKTPWYNYCAVAFVGLTLFGICFYLSPNTTNYKSFAHAGLWLYYELYITVSSPLNFMLLFTERYAFLPDMLFKLFLPLLLSSMQFAGGTLKNNQLKKLKP